ncbi:LuxR family transcriptional regulator [uncultured Senegalimassilia sp.]|uniref:LuxR family transcriptional regulator n=1 Tax=uncultured Senegalimassilia sp. TaxID=1714350 RepID=UPI0025FC9D02|nr:LuxR family transcriptional regulator [uncultured Senegalimassilia sp.]
MGVRVPRITLNADFGDESAFGELSLLSVGYGLHQAWVYATMFGTASVFGPMPCFEGLYGSSVTLPYLISSIVYIFAMLFIAATDQRFLKLYTSRKLLCIGGALSCVGSLLLLAAATSDMPLAETASGIMTGIGSAILIVYWGTAFARTDSASIVLNTAIAISIAIGLFATVLHYAPFPVSAIAIACVPLLELAVLLKKTPEPFHERNEVPFFKPLPINRGKFVLRFGAPVLVLGIALGMLRSNSLQNLVTKASVGAQPMLLLAAGCATVLVLVTIMALGGGDRWSRFFQPLVPFIAVTVFLMPLAGAENAALTSVIMLVGFLCFESLMWIFFADLSQRFRLSPVFVFALGRSIMAFAILFGTLVPVALANYAHLLPFGEQTLVILLLLVIVFAYALLPREREIESIIMPCPLVKAVSASFERKEESQRAAGLRNSGAAMGMDVALEQAVAESAPQREQTADNLLNGEGKPTTGNQAAEGDGTAPAGAPLAAGTAAADRAEAEAAPCEAPAAADNATAYRAACEDGEDAANAEPAGAASGPEGATAVQPVVNMDGTEGATTSAATPSALPMSRERQATQPAPAANAETRFAKPNEPARGGGRFRGKCETVANTFLLSRRETEILFFLAKGHNAAYIQEKLYISEGTAKTHIRHIYRKCDVHNQQDLMRMVEDAQPTE